MELHPYTQCYADISKYTKVKRIKKGGFGSIYLVQEKKTGNFYVAKNIDCDDNIEQCQTFIDREIGIMMLVNHPTIIKFICFSLQDFQGENNVTIIMDFAQNGSLSDVLKKIQDNDGPSDYTNTTRQKILIGVARGMKYLHDRNIIHRDLKPENVLLDENLQPHITDFGLSKFFEVNHSKSQSQTVGTLPYMSPEVIKGVKYGTAADVYSFGILMFEVLTDSPPYPDIEKMAGFDFMSRVSNENYRPKFVYPVKELHRELIEECWSEDPSSRPSFEEIFNKLTQSEYFLDDVDVDDVEIYVQDITEVRDPVEKLIHEKDVLVKENQESKEANERLKKESLKMKTENEQLKTENARLVADNENLMNENAALKSNVVTQLKGNAFIEYINAHKIIPVKPKEESLIQRIKKLCENEFVLGFCNEEDNRFITKFYPFISSYYGITGSLNQHLEILGDQARFWMFYRIAQGMKFLHSQKKIHGKLSLQTILIGKCSMPMIVDFGLYELSGENLIFTAPEIFEGKEALFASDVYSYSMIVYQIITNKKPSIDGSLFMVPANITKGKRPDLSAIKDKGIKTLIQKCWSKNPNNRPTFDQIVDIMKEESFYSIFGIKSLSTRKKISLINILCLGWSISGKSSMILTYKNQNKTYCQFSTIGIDFFQKKFKINDETIDVRIWDTSGAEKYFKISCGYTKNSHAIILFTNVSHEKEYLSLTKFIDEIDSNCDKRPPLYLATAFIDRGWKSTKEEIQEFANENNLKLFITSICDINSINSMFDSIVNDVLTCEE